MKRFFVTLVSHCEKVWWDPGYRSLRMAADAMLTLQAWLEHRLGRVVTSTFCTFVDHLSSGEVVVDAAEVPDVVQRVLDGGGELGLHVHAPTASLASGAQDQFIAEDARRIAKLGFPSPTAYAAGDFVTSRGTISALEEADIQVDCSVYALEGPLERFGLHIDYRRPNLMPYRVSREDLCSEGSSRVIELPVSGWLPEFHSRAFAQMPLIQQRILDRYAALEDGVDVFQVFWHPFEIVTLDGKDNDALRDAGIRAGQGQGQIGVNEAVMSAVRDFLGGFAEKPGVEIAHAGAAVTAWSQA